MSCVIEGFRWALPPGLLQIDGLGWNGTGCAGQRIDLVDYNPFP
jgi:hypothetical protein